MTITESSIQQGIELKIMQFMFSSALSAMMVAGNYFGLLSLTATLTILLCIAAQLAFFHWKLRSIFFKEACQEYGLKGNENLAILFRKFGLPTWL